MTQNVERIDDQRSRGPAGARWRTTEPHWWARPWIIPLLAVIIWFLIYQVNQFWGVWGTSKAPVSPHPGFTAYFPLLGAHMTAGFVALACATLQVWPWVRDNHPAVHRASGRIYVLASLVGGSCGLAIVRFAPPSGRLGIILATVMWMSTSAIGFVLAWRGKYVLHRRFMLYSFATLLSIIWGTVIVKVGMAFPVKVDTVYLNYLIEASRWLGWVVDLVAVQWWLLRSGQPTELYGRKSPA